MFLVLPSKHLIPIGRITAIFNHPIRQTKRLIKEKKELDPNLVIDFTTTRTKFGSVILMDNGVIIVIPTRSWVIYNRIKRLYGNPDAFSEELDAGTTDE